MMNVAANEVVLYAREDPSEKAQIPFFSFVPNDKYGRQQKLAGFDLIFMPPRSKKLGARVETLNMMPCITWVFIAWPSAQAVCPT